MPEPGRSPWPGATRRWLGGGPESWFLPPRCGAMAAAGAAAEPPPAGHAAQPEPEPLPSLPLRLDTLLGRAGQSRQQVAVLLLEGRITVAAAAGSGGAAAPQAVASDPASLVFPTDCVQLDGQVVLHQHQYAGVGRLFAVTKPRGMVVEHGRGALGPWLHSLEQEQAAAEPLPTVGPDETTRQSPPSAAVHEAPARRAVTFVGRLDKQTSGLLLATADGDLCSLVCESPHCEKTYVATVRCTGLEEPTYALCPCPVLS